MQENWATLWERVSDTIPDATAVVQGERSLSYRELDDRAARLAAALVERGLGKDSKVGILAYNCIEYLEGAYATFKFRGSPVNLNYRYKDQELLDVLLDSDAEALLFHGTFADTVARVAPNVPTLTTLVQIDDGSPLADGAVSYDELVASHEPMPRIKRSGDDVFLIYTGGTTGLPRGVMWRHADIVHTVAAPSYMIAGVDLPTTVDEVAQAALQMRKLGASGVVIPAPPMIHGTAFYLSKGAWLMGGTVVILEGRSLDGHEIWRAVQQHRVNQLVIVGDPFARALVTALEEAEAAGTPYDISSVRSIASSGVLWSEHWKQALVDRGRMALVDMVGASEGGPFSVQTVPPKGRVADCKFVLSPRSKLVDATGTVIPPGSDEIGQLAVAPPYPLGYYKDEPTSAALFREVEGTRHTVPGDFAQVRADGEVVLLGRGALCINTGGEKVYPQEVETAITALDGVLDVNIVGVPDEQWGEAITAVVAARPGVTEDDVKSAVRERLSGYKVPRHVVFVEQILRSPAGKARYAWARETALAGISRSEPRGG